MFVCFSSPEGTIFVVLHVFSVELSSLFADFGFIVALQKEFFLHLLLNTNLLVCSMFPQEPTQDDFDRETSFVLAEDLNQTLNQVR